MDTQTSESIAQREPETASEERAADVASLRGDMFAWIANQWESKRPFDEGGFESWCAGWKALAEATGAGDDVLRQLADVGDAGEAIVREHDALFVTRASFYAAPFESVYVGASKDDVGWSLSRLKGFPFKQVKVEYARDGFEPPKDLDADHLSLELRYMAALCIAEAEAFAAKDLARVKHLREREREFLTEHLLAWLPTLCARLAGSDEETFYPHASRVMLAYVEGERDYLTEPVD